MKERKRLIEWVREILGRHTADVEELPDVPSEDVVTSLISRASGTPPPEKGEGKDEPDKGGDGANPSGSDTEKKGCSYAVKRNIVASLQEIRRFAEENNLAGTMVRALLTLLAEMAIGALRGKVSQNVLDALLKVFSYERALADAYSRGERDGRNAGITEEFFPEGDDGLPHFNGFPSGGTKSPDIFTLANEA